MKQYERSINVVIAGAGFGGLSAAKQLANKKNVNVVLIDQHNYHLFQPLLYQVATAALTPAEIASPIRQVFRCAKNVAVYMDKVNAVDSDKRQLLTEGGLEFDYDYLVLATGARHSYFGRDEWAPLAPGLKTIDDAFHLRQRILTAFEKAEMAQDPVERQNHLNFVIVGAGPTGVEMAGAIAELARYTLTEDFRHITPESARIILVNAGPRILISFDEDLSRKAQQHLEKLGVEVVLNTRVNTIEPGRVHLHDSVVDCKTVIWAAGVEASPAGQWLGVATDRSGRIPVNPDLTVPGHEKIFAVGDTAACIPEGARHPLPGLAPVAKQQGTFVAKLILAKIQCKKKLPVFRYRDYGTMATIGRNQAIADLGFAKFSGFFGWWLWGLAHIYYLIGFRSRLFVGLSWFWAYLSYQRGVRLITGTQAQDEDDNKASDSVIVRVSD